MKNLLSNIKEWIKNHRVASAFIALAIIMIAFAIDDSENQKQDEQNKNEVAQTETKESKPDKKESKVDEKESKPKEVTEETEELEKEASNTDVEEIEQPEKEGLSPEFKENTSNYFMQLSSAYSTLGELTTAETESEMMSIIKDAQSEYDLTNEYYTALDPQTKEEKAVFKKISKVDGLAARALMNAEDGLNRYDTDTIDSATEDIEESSVVMDEIMNDIE